MLRTAALGLLAAAVLATPTTSFASSTADPVAPTLVGDASTITAGESAVLSGWASPGATVSLYAYSRPSTTYAFVRDGVAAADGAFAFPVQPTTNSRYYVESLGVKGGTASIAVRTAVTLDPVTVDGNQVLVDATLFPAPSGALVDVVFTREEVRTVEFTAVASPRFGYRVSFASDRRGAFLVSVAVPSTRDNVAGESAAQQVVVRAPQAGEPV